MPQFTNQASLTYNGVTVNSNIVTGELNPTLSATKTATAGSYGVGDVVTYVVSLRNTGTAPFTGITLTDDLGAYQVDTVTRTPLTYTGDPVLYYIDGVLQSSPVVVAGPPMVISGINVPAGSDAVIVYRARVNEFAPLGTGGNVVNTATLTGGGLTEAVTADATVNANTATRLAIVKALDPAVVSENGQITYTFTIQNFGDEATDAAAITVTDTFNPRLDAPITVTLNGATLTEAGNYTYDATTGLFATVPGIITVPAATAAQDPVTGVYTLTPGVAVLTVTGTV